MAEMHPQSSASEPRASQNTKSTNHSNQKPDTKTSPQPSPVPPNPSAKLTSKLKSTSYPPPLITPPLSTHLHSIIILHGRGSSASSFAPPLLSTPISPSQALTLTLRTTLPHAKFIFPTASKRRAVLYNRTSINQWFDYSSLTEPTMEREELQIEGLWESSAYIHSLLREEIEIVGAGNVVLGGLSQGCAASLIALLMWEGQEPLGAAFGMCGWLPFRKQMEEIIARPQYDANDDEDDPFERSGQGGEESDPPTQAIEFLCEEVGVSGVQPSMSFHRTPLFLGHGTEDEKVSLHLGVEAANCLRILGMQVSWTQYDGLAHWYSAAMLSDLLDFLQGLDLGSAIRREMKLYGEQPSLHHDEYC
ncbi:hypothetical protein JMJ35_009761 [Cladonia borealis]|uniref:Phospholipase/carboxylesterase/thioesterase domain-containing protein n=1 Tax=Cladonia borealis TaxID=184061 RepID=A0AA39QRJ1_9LECA|nr:hypothetical protein JMJ35_009761 [Cladonia borealis]